MLSIEKNTIIYVYCPANVITGGAELMHQLVDTLCRFGRNAYIYYFNNPQALVPEDYRSYNIHIAERIEDDEKNIEVFYEGICNILFEHEKTQKFLWWISVDNFYYCSKSYISLFDLWKWNHVMAFNEFQRRLKALCHGVNYFRGTLHLRSMKNIVCGYQSEYAHHFLLNHGFYQVVALKDFINTDYKEDFDLRKKEDIVLYNPKKGYQLTRRLIESSKDLKWVPLENMTRQEVREVLLKAKVYVDFGNHPGKDRLPRECLMSGCIVITGESGSASYFEDIAISKSNKFLHIRNNENQIIERIRYVMAHYSESIKDYDFYRRKVKIEKKEFEDQVHLIFDC